MIPIRDDQPCFTTPVVTYFLIAVNLLILLLQSAMTARGQEALIAQFALIPTHVELGLAGGAGGLPGAVLPLFTSMFLHGGWMHVLGNVWVLWIFGDNIEDYLGRLPYLFFYVLCGLAAAVLHVALNWGSRVPTVGASGAIAGVMGAYLLLYPRARVATIFPPIFFFTLPAWIVLGYWMAAQLLSGALTAVAKAGRADTGGIAFWAHVGGFLSGMALIKILPERSGRYRYGTW